MLLPSCYFDKAKCELGLIALRNYRSDYNEKLGTYLEKPRHDKYSHASDAFRYLAVTLRPAESLIQILQRKKAIQRHNKEIYDPFEF